MVELDPLLAASGGAMASSLGTGGEGAEVVAALPQFWDSWVLSMPPLLPVQEVIPGGHQRN